MSSSVTSNFESQPESGSGVVRPGPNPSPDPERTVIRQGALLDAPSEVDMLEPPETPLGFRQSTNRLIGQRLDHFLIESLVGTGGMGAVFRGRDTRLNREVAIKVVPIADHGAEAMRRFRVEAQSAAKLDHPNIARVYYVGETAQWSYIVFEFVEGTNLRELVVRQGLLSIDDAVCLTRQIAEALQHAADRRVVHRDIKPSNILVTQSGQAKLVDMGLARTTELDKSTNDLTASGVTLGTFDYISPEQAHDPREADVRSDIYSLGCTLYFLLTGQPPFPDGTALQKLLLHGTKMPEDPRTFRSEISDSMIAVLRKMMAKKPSDRYQEPNDLIHDLRILAEVDGLAWSQASDNMIALPTAAQRTWIEALLPLLVSVMLVLGITMWLHSSSYLSATFPIPRVDYLDTQAEFATVDRPSDLLLNSNVVKLEEEIVPKSSEMSELSAPEVSAVEKGWKSAADLVPTKGSVFVDPNAPADRELSDFVVRTLEQALEIAKTQSQIDKIVIQASSLTTSLASLRSGMSFHSNLTIQSGTGQRCRWILEGTEPASDVSPAVAWIGAFEGQLIFQNIDILWRVSSQQNRRSLFSVRPNGWLQFKDCSITVQADSGASFDSPLQIGALAHASVVCSDAAWQDSSDEPSVSNASRLVARVTGENLSVRGQCDFLRMATPIRTEVLIENGWLAITGSVFELTGSRSPVRSGVPLRIDLRNVTSYSQRAWMHVALSNSHPFPIPIVRTARECVFTGCKSLVEWDASECDNWKIWEQSDEGEKMSRWIDLRGTDNVYDTWSLSEFLKIQLLGNQSEQIELGADARLIREERGLETIAAWRKRPTLEAGRMHEVIADALEWIPGPFAPGYKYP